MPGRRQNLLERLSEEAAIGCASLENTSRGVAEIAADVGYESEAAYNRAFKREFGQPPGRYRGDRKAPPAQRPREVKHRSAFMNLLTMSNIGLANDERGHASAIGSVNPY